jgi:light-regulated signal transduction histidine kinase (bacteriophytochrome)
LERSNAELQQFAYVASHDLQEPLRGVAGSVELLQQRFKGMLDAKAKSSSPTRSRGRPDADPHRGPAGAVAGGDRAPRAAAATDSGRVLKAALDNLAVAIRESGARSPTTRSRPLTVDTTQLLQLFQNLISNAIKFRGAGPEGPRLRRRGKASWRFSVKDNGIGIEPQYFERIFRIFQRLHTRASIEGQRHRLAVCKKIVERHRRPHRRGVRIGTRVDVLSSPFRTRRRPAD